jgi:hypothetical protein
MGLMVFKTRQKAEAFMALKQESVPSGAVTFQVEECFAIKRRICFPDAPYEYLMEDGAFLEEDKEGRLIYNEFDLSIHVVPPPEE